MEKGEEPYASARREVLEETGLTVGCLDLCAILFIDIGDTPGIEVFVFSAQYSGGQTRQSEEGLLEWKSIEEINTSDQIVDDVPMLVNFCIEHEIGEMPQLIKYSYDKNGQLRIDKIKV